jgi:hypothetical protein
MGKIFFIYANRKANWVRPSGSYQNIKLFTFHFKNGSTVEFKKQNKHLNIFWRYVFPLKYYFLKYFNKVQKRKQRHLEGLSLKWKIKDFNN